MIIKNRIWAKRDDGKNSRARPWISLSSLMLVKQLPDKFMFSLNSSVSEVRQTQSQPKLKCPRCHTYKINLRDHRQAPLHNFNKRNRANDRLCKNRWPNKKTHQKTSRRERYNKVKPGPLVKTCQLCDMMTRHLGQHYKNLHHKDKILAYLDMRSGPKKGLCHSSSLEM